MEWVELIKLRIEDVLRLELTLTPEDVDVALLKMLPGLISQVNRVYTVTHLTEQQESDISPAV